MTSDLRNAGIRAEMYVGYAGIEAQMKNATSAAAPASSFRATDERVKGEVTFKDSGGGAFPARSPITPSGGKGVRRSLPSPKRIW